MNIYKCPVCGLLLNDEGRTLRCKKNHSFDRAASGYVNLLISNARRHGDDKLMVKSRAAFLEKGYYKPLLDAASDLLVRYFGGGLAVDAGCGEGYYTSGISRRLNSAGLAADVVAVDISKNAADHTARRHCASDYAVASVYSLPLFDGCADAVVNIFSPLCAAEYLRILKYGGLFLYAIPLEEHLYGLKKIIYDKPYYNEVKSDKLEGFELLESEDIKYPLTIEGADDVANLFKMTPYYYTTSESDRDKIKNTDRIEMSAAFRVFLYKKAADK